MDAGKLILVYILLLFFGLTFSLNFHPGVAEQQFFFLAKSFLAGKTYFLEMPERWIDTAVFMDRNYWPLGPFPAIILAPFVFLGDKIGLFFRQGYLQFPLILGVFFLVYKIAKHYHYDHRESLFWAFGFCFSSVFLNVAILPWSWFFSHIITVFLLFWTIHEYLHQKRFLLIGGLLALALATRITAGMAVLFFIGDIFSSPSGFRKKTTNTILILLPLLAAVILLAGYNYSRFGNIREQGYSFQLLLTDELKATRDQGIFSPVHVPGNLYHFLIAGPLPVFRDDGSHVFSFPFLKADPWGMSLFVTSPYFLYLFLFSYKDRFSKLVLLTCGLIFLILSLYYGVGYKQFGYRYSLDFLPFLFWLLLKKYKETYSRLLLGFKSFLVLPAFSNFWFFWVH